MSSEVIRGWEKQCARELSRAEQRRISHVGVHRAVQEVVRFYPARAGDEYTEKYWSAVALHLKGQVPSEDAARVVLTEFLSIPRNRPERLSWAIRQGNQDLVATCLREKCIPGPKHLATAVQVDPSLKLFKMLVHAQKGARELTGAPPLSELASAPQPLSQALGINPPQPMADLWLTEEGMRAVAHLLSQSWVTADSRTMEAVLHTRGAHAWKLVEILVEAKAPLDQRCLRAALSNEEIHLATLKELIVRGRVRIGYFDPQTTAALFACPPDRIFVALQALLERGVALYHEDFLKLLSLDISLEECIQFCRLVVPNYLPPSSALLTMMLRRYNADGQDQPVFQISPEDYVSLITPWIREYGVQSKETVRLFAELLEEALVESSGHERNPLPLLETLYLGMPDDLRNRVLDGLQEQLSNTSRGSFKREKLFEVQRQLLMIAPPLSEMTLGAFKRDVLPFMLGDPGLSPEVIQQNVRSFMRSASEPPLDVVQGHILPFLSGWTRKKGGVSVETRGLWEFLFVWNPRTEGFWSTFRWIQVAHTIEDLGIAREDLEALKEVMEAVGPPGEDKELSGDQDIERMMALVAKLTATTCLKEDGETIQQAGKRAQKILVDFLENLRPRAQAVVERQLELFWERYAPRSEHPPIGTVSEAHELAAQWHELTTRWFNTEFSSGNPFLERSYFGCSYWKLWQFMMERAAQDPKCPVTFLMEMLRSKSIIYLSRDELAKTVQQCVAAAMLTGDRRRVKKLLSCSCVQECLTLDVDPRAKNLLHGLLLALKTLPRASLQKVLEQDGEWLVALLVRHRAPCCDFYAMLAETLPPNTPRLLRMLIDGGKALDRPTMRHLTTAVLEARDVEALQLLPEVQSLDGIDPNEGLHSRLMSKETIRSIFSLQADASFHARWLRFLEEDLGMVHTIPSLRALLSVAGESETLNLSKLERDMRRLGVFALWTENPLIDAPDALITRLVSRPSTFSSPSELDLLPYVIQATFERASPLHEMWLPHIMRAMKSRRDPDLYASCHGTALQAAIQSKQEPLLDFVEKIAQALSSVHDSFTSRLWTSFKRVGSRLFGGVEGHNEDRSLVLRAAISTCSPDGLRMLITAASSRAIATDPNSLLFQDIQVILNTLTEGVAVGEKDGLLDLMADCIEGSASAVALPGLGAVLSGWSRRARPRSIGDLIGEQAKVVEQLVGRREGMEWLLQSAPEVLLVQDARRGRKWPNMELYTANLRTAFVAAFQNWEEAQPILEVLVAQGAAWIDGELLLAAERRPWDVQSLKSLMLWLRKLGRDLPSVETWKRLFACGIPKEDDSNLSCLLDEKFPSMLLDTTRTVQELRAQLEENRDHLLQASVSQDDRERILEQQLIATLEWARRRRCSTEETLALLSIVIPHHEWLPTDAEKINCLIQAVWDNCSVKAAIDVLALLMERGLRPPLGDGIVSMMPIELYPQWLSQQIESGGGVELGLGEIVMKRLPLLWIEGKRENGLNPEAIRIMCPLGRPVTSWNDDFWVALEHPGPTTPAIIRILAVAGGRAGSMHLTAALELLLNRHIDPRYAGDLLRSLTRGLDGRVIAGATWVPEIHGPLVESILEAEHIPAPIKRVIQNLYVKGIARQSSRSPS